MPRAMVLCAGYGTRLRPLTDELPKPLVPIGDRPLLVHIAQRLEAAGFVQLVINTHHIAEEFHNVIRDFRLEARVLHEPEILGTAGGVANARRWLGPAPVIVWNGDILADPPLADLLAAAESGALVLAASRAAAGLGTIGVGRDGAVVRLRGHHFGKEASGGDYIGVAAIGARVLAALPETGCLVGDVALPALDRGERVEVVWTRGSFSDAGDIAAYHALNLQWLRDRGADSFVAPGAIVGADISLVGSVVGAGARIVGQGKLERCIVWPHATAEAPLSDAIVMRSGRLVSVTAGSMPSP